MPGRKNCLQFGLYLFFDKFSEQIGSRRGKKLPQADGERPTHEKQFDGGRGITDSPETDWHQHTQDHHVVMPGQAVHDVVSRE